MNGVELKAWREARGLTQATAASGQGVSERAWQNYENGSRPIPAELVSKLTGEPLPVAAKISARLDVIEGGADPSAFDPVRAGLRPYPSSNTQFGASINFDRREVAAPWKRVAGCCRVVHESIPDPVPFYAPTWAGWRGVPTASGRVFDFETGHEMRDYNARAMAKPAAIAAAGAARPKGGADKPRRR